MLLRDISNSVVICLSRYACLCGAHLQMLPKHPKVFHNRTIV